MYRLKLLFVNFLFFCLAACSPGDPVTSNGMADSDSSPTVPLSPPNILYIVADDLGFTDLGAFGSEIPTPNLDRLAYAGLRLNNFHAAPACRSSRLMMMSGVGHAAANFPMPEAGRGGVLGLDYAIIPELLQDAGYATYITGKWDLGDVEGYRPHERGFDRSFVEIGGAASYFPQRLLGRLFGYQEDGRQLTLEDLPDDFYATAYYTDKMLEFLRSTDEGTPWFAYMPYTAPHWPLQLPDDWLDRHAGNYDDGYDALRERRFVSAGEAGVLPAHSTLDGFEPLSEPWADLSPGEQRRYARAQEIFAGMIEYLDMSIGRVIDYMEESGQIENTVIVFTADHGASPSEHGVDTGRGPRVAEFTIPDTVDNRLENFGRPNSLIDHGRGFGEAASAPFKDQKGSVTEGGLRAAAFVHYPAAVAGGEVSNAFMTMMDMLPTFLEIAATEHPGAGPYRDDRIVNDIVGRSAWPHLTGVAEIVHSQTDAAGWASGDGGALIRGDYKIINRPPFGSTGSTPWRLYDLSIDPGERNDIAAEHPELVAELVAELEANWR